MGFLHSLECLCVKATSGSIQSDGAFVKSKISCNPATLRASISAIGKIVSPPKTIQSAPKTISSVSGFGPYYNISISDLSGLEDLQVGNTCYIPHYVNSVFVSNFYYEVSSITNNALTIKYLYNSENVGLINVDQLCSQTINSSCVQNVIFNIIQSSTNPKIVRLKAGNSTISAEASISSKISGSFILKSNLIAQASVSPGLKANYALKQPIIGISEVKSKYTDKFHGTFSGFECLQKLYPSGDIALTGVKGFLGPANQTTNLYSYIDEGVFTGDYTKNFGQSQLISDDKNSYIQPSSTHTNDTFQYKCSITKPIVKPQHSNFRMRASAPLFNYESKIPPKYTVTDIKLEDPNGALIIEYDDIIFRGDANYSDANYVNFTTYSSAPKLNRANMYEWQSGYPDLRSTGIYTLSFKVISEDLGDSFDSGFSEGFQEDAYSTSGTLPIASIRISAIEICNSGGIGPSVENYINIFTEVQASGKRIQRSIYPTAMPIYTFDPGIYPLASSVWKVNGSAFTNETIPGSKEIVNTLRQTNESYYINLQSTGPIQDSGKLTLKFGHQADDKNFEVNNAAFNFAFDESLYNKWTEPSGAFDTFTKTPIDSIDNFFTVESVTLKVLAKKAVGSRDYVLDVVGYSDDKLLNVTSAVGGFLQNISGVGSLPSSSGFLPTNDLAIDGESISDRSQYYQASGTNNTGGDHYSLVTTPVVNSTSFAWYEIPLKIYEDSVEIGKSRDYTMSSMFENLYLDIFPIPSGASISSIYLSVRYKPQNALQLVIEGGEQIRKIQNGRSEGSLYPTSRQSNDDIINAGSGYAPLSKILNIPHGFSTPTTIKTNYSRRWRGMEGLANGDFDPNQFSFSFYNPLLDFPFTYGFYDFDYDEGKTINSRISSNSGNFSTNYGNNKYRYKNIGWRFTNHTIFNDQLPGYSGAYQTTDWTSLSSGNTNFINNPLYGHISDAVNNVVRIHGEDSYIDFNHGFNPSDGFSVYVKFTPDVDVSGSTYNLFNSGVLVSKWGRHNNPTRYLEFAIAYESGYLCGLSRDTAGNIIKVKDTVPYSGYQYPLPVILTYNEKGLSGLKLYTDNELVYPWTTLRASSVPYNIYSADSDVLLGYCPGSGGIGMNMFVSEFGLAEGCKLVQSNPNLQQKETTVDTFFANQRVKWWNPSESFTRDTYSLWNNVDENTYTDWHIGDFKYCQFDSSFDFLTKRTGRDLISFNMVSDGIAYSQKTNIALPSSINSSVCYHTQIENDFLRFYLSDTEDNFHSTLRRITKSLPRGYKFSEKALVVDTIIEHDTTNDIVWNDGSIGPKLIVSLYTKKQEPYWTPNESNWGLINRAIHYVPPSSCMIKLESTFTYDSLIDQSEAWALFPVEPRIKEFEEKYYSQDIDDMFLQYDLVYPSGSAFKSRLNIHSAHVRMEDAYVNATMNSGVFNLLTSGNPSPVNQKLNLHTGSYVKVDGNTFNLYTIGPLKIQNSGMPLYASGALVAPENLDLFITGLSGVVNQINIYTSGGTPKTIYQDSGSLNISLFGKGIITSQDNNVLGISLTAFNAQQSNIPDGGVLDLFTFGSSGALISRANMPLYMINDHDTDLTGNSGVLNLTTIGSEALFTRYPNGSLNLFIFSNQPKEQLNLTLYGDNLTTVVSENSINLFTANYNETGSSYLRWFNDNYGTNISLEDNSYASVLSSDEIRGVDLIAYGSCYSDSDSKAIDPAIITHDTVWREETCNDGGIFRAKQVYTNLSAGYSGNYYGIRKYQDLVPNSAYNVTLKVTTGDTEPIPVPREWEEWEYGTNNSINFSGIKLIGDYSYQQQNEDIAQSGRNSYDNYGAKVVVKKDLMAVGSPLHEIPDESGYAINNAGSVFLYRRLDDVAGEKASWTLEDKLMLPSGYRRDFISKTISNLMCYPNATSPQFCISGQKWNIGQQGREFGFSLDVAYSGDRQVVAVGAPGASWNRSFENIVTSGIPVCMMVFTDKFVYDKVRISNISNSATKWDNLYKYFSAPWSGFQPKLDIKVIVCQLSYSDDNKPVVPDDEKSWFRHVYLERLDDKKLINEVGYQNVYNGMLSGVKDVFIKSFPRNTNVLHSNIPAILGVFRDSSPSTALNGINGGAFKPVVDDFISFYNQYSFLSGVKDYITSSSASGYYNLISGESEKWDQDSVQLMQATLDSGNLISNNALRFVTSGVGQQWARPNSYEFQIPPASGGRVYIFERENGKFNLVQEIKSPDETAISQAENSYDFSYAGDYGSKANDRFGHSVSISENGEILAIGSPYSNKACQIFERDDSENERMFSKLQSWLTFRGFTSEVESLNNLTEISGAKIAREATYNNLSQSNKFLLRSDETFWGSNGGPINLYQKIYDYSYSDIPYTGTWQFIPNEYAGTSRLGYSSAVSEDGDTVAFGAPTDSFNEFDDTNMWYKSQNTWASYTNAGAVRVFESRKYYPHNLVVEFYKFGNLDKNSHPEYAEYYDQMGLYFEPSNIPFRRTEFSEINIPQEAGLAFIITPEIDAASDEIINNIKNWLSLGDRTLVLVGNDPVWEENGKYKKSNDIINKILYKLNSRMRLYPARNRYESLQDCVTVDDYNNDKYNVTPSVVPAYSHDTYITPTNLFAKGVADIRIDVSTLGLSGLRVLAPCDNGDENPQNPFCEMYIGDMGDLRAQWNMICQKTEGEKVIDVKYKENWPFHFGNDNPAQKCDDYPQNPKPLINRKNQDPRPILTAAEWLSSYDVTIPAQSGYTEETTPIYEYITVGSTYWEFADSQLNYTEFNIQQSGNNVPSGNFSNFTIGTFSDPESFDSRDSLIQATGVEYAEGKQRKVRRISEESVLASEEQYGSSSSTVVLLASLLPENARNLGYGTDPDLSNNNKDKNNYFFVNMVMESCGNKGSIIQLGGWTGRSSFVDAFADSRITKVFDSYDQSYQENYTGAIDPFFNVVWIANPLNKPSTSEINQIKSWLNSGNKKLVITYGNDQKIADNVYYICDKLNLSSRPFYSESQSEYLVQSSSAISGGNDEALDVEDPIQKVDSNNGIIKGCVNGYYPGGPSTTLTRISLYGDDTSYIPIRVYGNTSKIIYYVDPIYEAYYETPYAWKIDAQGSITFDVLPGSGYRMFINWVSENVSEKFDIAANVNGILVDADPNSEEVSSTGVSLGKTITYNPEVAVLDFRIPNDSNKLTINFDTRQHYKIDSVGLNGSIPKTPRLLSISGCLLPAVEKVAVSEIKKLIGTETVKNYWYEPEQVITIPAQFRSIQTDSSKYCIENNCPGKLIEDGPIIVAEEFENFSSFTNGSQRSRIVLVSDSTMIQGQCPHYRNDALGENQLFIRGLYPPSPDVPNTLNLNGASNSARQFSFTQKILAPERGSPAKYYAASGTNAYLVNRFGLNGVAGNLQNYTSQENDYDFYNLTREANPVPEEKRKQEIKKFGTDVIPVYGVYPRFSGVVNGQLYVDANIGGGTPEILAKTGKDYIDFDTYPSGYPGDLFGYSIDIHKNKLVVGAPFHGFYGEDVYTWASGQSRLQLSANGGAGAVFYYEKTNSGENSISETLPWEFKQKIKPSSINVGLDSATTGTLYNLSRISSLPSNFVLNYAPIADQFGYDVSIDADFLAVGAPGHDYETLHDFTFNAPFIRKEFNSEFAIPQHKFYDLGSSGIRIDQYNNLSGVAVLNNGAVFTFTHKVTDWQSQAKKWTVAQKLVAQGYNSRNQVYSSGCENDFFGRSVSIDRARRGDSDYVLAVGSPNHKYPTSGQHITGTLEKAGAAYTYDAMLREQLASIPNSGGWIKATIFGHKPQSQNEVISLTVNQNTSGGSITYLASGLIFANENGDIFIEASGYDPATKGFIAHRPYVESVIGDGVNGSENSDILFLTTSGTPASSGDNLNLSILGDSSAFVYNNMNLLTSSWTVAQIGSGVEPAFNLIAIGTSGIPISGGMNIFMSGIGLVDNTPLNLRIRGK